MKVDNETIYALILACKKAESELLATHALLNPKYCSNEALLQIDYALTQATSQPSLMKWYKERWVDRE